MLLLAALLLSPAHAAKNKDKDKGEEPEPHLLQGLPLRNIGPAFTGGRVSDFAVVPGQSHVYYAATASGHLWKTGNAGTTWTPLFQNEGSYAIGVVELDPSNPQTVWVGTGENNAQRSVAAGDGVYRSDDGGSSWTKMGLEDSGHISQIWVDPTDSDTVLVAAQGPLWSEGGDRGLYKTVDGGTTWEALLTPDEHTGINEFVVDPRNPDHIVASSYQRRRHVWTLINGGPSSGIHRSTDGGKTWKKVSSGLPGGDLGRIGLAGAPSSPDTLYAIIEAEDGDARGVYRSTNFGASWSRQSDHLSGSPQYYQELVVDPHDASRVYSLDTFTHVSEDAGKTWTRLGAEFKHVDDHALWIDPDYTGHLRMGCDGGIYESFDHGQTWRHLNNLPIAQFYRVQPDNAEPFYNVCGGTQDNNSLCAPSRTTLVHGITRADWDIILGGDGYEAQFDPDDPNIIYTQYQYGGLARYDKRSREALYITPHPAEGADADKWNWNTPLLVSPHDGKRLYYASERLYRSDDRGDSWQAISPDLTRQIDRNTLEVMGRVWGVDTVAKNDSTSKWGSAIALAESPVQEGLLYVGTDDGVLNISADGGGSWERVETFKGVPEQSLIEDVWASQHDVNRVYAVFDNHKRGDWKPYVFRSDDRGQSWKPIVEGLPERGYAHTIAEDHVDPNLLFVGTELGLYFTQDRGESWHPLTGNFPTIAVRDVEIQRRENDLVVGTFGRGIYILDDYTPLRTAPDALTEKPAHLFGVRDPWQYVEGSKWGGGKKASQGDALFTADNPAFGAVFTYTLSEGLQSLAEARKEREAELAAEGEDTPYPSWEELRAEDREEAPAVVLIVQDADGNAVRRLTGPVSKGVHRVAWDLRWPAPDPVSLQPAGFAPSWAWSPKGAFAAPGEYTVSLALRQGGALEVVAGPEPFTIRSLDQGPEAAEDQSAVFAFHRQAGALRGAVQGAGRLHGELGDRVAHLKVAVVDTPGSTDADDAAVRALEAKLTDIGVALYGDSTVTRRNEPAPWGVSARAGAVYTSLLDSRAPVPQLHQDSYQVAVAGLEAVLADLAAAEKDVRALEDRITALGGPWTPGRMPNVSK